MTETKRQRINFYPKENISNEYTLSKIEEFFENYKQENEFALIDLIEFYNIKLYFDNNLFPANWTNNKKTEYIEIVKKTVETLKKQILSINDYSLESELNNLDYNYFNDYWSLLVNLHVYKKINEITITKILKNNPSQIHQIISQKNLVDKFDKVIRVFLMDYGHSAELILSVEEKRESRNNNSKYFPKSLSISDKEIIVDKYLDSEKPNLNYVRLIENSIDSQEFKLNAKTRLKAKKKSKELNKKIFENGNFSEFGLTVSFNNDQIEPRKVISDGTNLKVSYSLDFIDQFSDNVSLFKLFKYLFEYTDHKNLISLVSKPSEIDSFERISMKSKNEYEKGFKFQRKENLADIKLYIYDHYLQTKGNNIETLINSYIDFINEKINPHKLIFKISLTEKNYVEKIRTIAPDFEFLLKQYKTFVDEKCIDLELIQIDSTPIRLSEISSFKAKKYLYSNDKLFLNLAYLFFSNQCLLSYIKPFENKYNNLCDLITNENVKLEYFDTYQKETIESLIKDSYLKIDNQENVVLNNTILIYIIREIHKDEVISYWNYPKAIRDDIDELIDKGLLIAENTLFTRQEIEYFNYYLNKKKFSNGYDLRNKYIHGTNSSLEHEHRVDYYRLLKIIVLTLLKIEDDITKIED